MAQLGLPRAPRHLPGHPAQLLQVVGAGHPARSGPQQSATGRGARAWCPALASRAGLLRAGLHERAAVQPAHTRARAHLRKGGSFCSSWNSVTPADQMSSFCPSYLAAAPGSASPSAPGVSSGAMYSRVPTCGGWGMSARRQLQVSSAGARRAAGQAPAAPARRGEQRVRGDARQPAPRTSQHHHHHQPARAAHQPAPASTSTSTTSQPAPRTSDLGSERL
jgi:hypothetical protein